MAQSFLCVNRPGNAWGLRCERMTPRYMTRWNELVSVKS
ncbi:DUF4113 domain-containing protein [Halomonas sp. YLB-10]